MILYTLTVPVEGEVATFLTKDAAEDFALKYRDIGIYATIKEVEYPNMSYMITTGLLGTDARIFKGQAMTRAEAELTVASYCEGNICPIKYYIEKVD